MAFMLGLQRSAGNPAPDPERTASAHIPENARRRVTSACGDPRPTCLINHGTTAISAPWANVGFPRATDNPPASLPTRLVLCALLADTTAEYYGTDR